jgi:ABC-type transport system involved in multi-copper enzyme maturation permease subunit
VIGSLRAELLKARSVPGIWVTFGLSLPLTALVIWATFAVAGGFSGHTYDFMHSLRLQRQMLDSGYFGLTFLAPVLGVLCITTEYRHKTITSTLVLTPRRGRVLVSKVLVVALWCAAMVVVSLIAVAAIGFPWNNALGGTVSQLTNQIGATVPGLFGAAILLGLFGLGFGTLVKNQVAGMLFTIGFTFILEPLLVALAHGVIHYDLNWLPSESAQALAGSLARNAFNSSQNVNSHLLTWWGGGLVTLAWGLIPLALGYFTTVRKDVT